MWPYKLITCVAFLATGLFSFASANASTCTEADDPNMCYNGKKWWAANNNGSAEEEQVRIEFTSSQLEPEFPRATSPIISTGSRSEDKDGNQIYEPNSGFSFVINEYYVGANNGGNGATDHYLKEIVVSVRRADGVYDYQPIASITENLDCDFDLVVIGPITQTVEHDCFSSPGQSAVNGSYFYVIKNTKPIILDDQAIHSLADIVGLPDENGLFPGVDIKIEQIPNREEAETTYGTITFRVVNGSFAAHEVNVDVLATGVNDRHEDNYIAFTPPENPEDEKLSIGYLGDWAVYGRGLNGAGFNFDNYDWVVHSFLGICSSAAKQEVLDGLANGQLGAEFENALTFYDQTCGTSEDGTLLFADEYAYSEKELSAPDGTEILGLKGLYEWHKANNRPVNFALSVGGWTLSHTFKHFEDEALRQTFISSLRTRLEDSPFFTGVDIDWEIQENNEEGALFVTLMEEIRDMLDALSASNGKDYRLSTALFSTADVANRIDFPRLSEAADAIYIMSYDFNGAWDQNIGFQTNLFPIEGKTPASKPGDAHEDQTEHSVATAVRRFLDLGVPAEKLYLGLAHYGRSMAMCPNGADISSVSPLEGFSCKSEASERLGIGSMERGFVEFWSHYDLYSPTNLNLAVTEETVTVGGNTYYNVPTVNGFHYFSDHLRNADYFLNLSAGYYYDMETARTVCLKARYIKNMGLAGALSWAVEYDNHILQNAFKYCLGYQAASDDYAEKINRLATAVSNHGASDAPDDHDWNDVSGVSGSGSVEDTEPPVITIDAEITIEAGSEFTDPGATALDNVDGHIPFESFSVTGDEVNTGVLGTYTLTYAVSDSSGNEASATRVVRVVKASHRTVVLSGSPITAETLAEYLATTDTLRVNLLASTFSFISLPLDNVPEGTRVEIGVVADERRNFAVTSVDVGSVVFDTWIGQANVLVFEYSNGQWTSLDGRAIFQTSYYDLDNIPNRSNIFRAEVERESLGWVNYKMTADHVSVMHALSRIMEIVHNNQYFLTEITLPDANEMRPDAVLYIKKVTIRGDAVHAGDVTKVNMGDEVQNIDYSEYYAHRFIISQGEWKYDGAYSSSDAVRLVYSDGLRYTVESEAINPEVDHESGVIEGLVDSGKWTVLGGVVADASSVVLSDAIFTSKGDNREIPVTLKKMTYTAKNSWVYDGNVYVAAINDGGYTKAVMVRLRNNSNGQVEYKKSIAVKRPQLADVNDILGIPISRSNGFWIGNSPKFKLKNISYRVVDKSLASVSDSTSWVDLDGVVGDIDNLVIAGGVFRDNEWSKRELRVGLSKSNVLENTYIAALQNHPNYTMIVLLEFRNTSDGGIQYRKSAAYTYPKVSNLNDLNDFELGRGANKIRTMRWNTYWNSRFQLKDFRFDLVN